MGRVIVGMGLNLNHTLILSTYRWPCFKIQQNPPTNHQNSLMGRNLNRKPIGSRDCRNWLKLDTRAHIIHIQVAIFLKLNKSNNDTSKELIGPKTQIVSPLGLKAAGLVRNFTKPFIQSISNYPKCKNCLKPKTEQSYSLLVSYCCSFC